MAKGWQSGKPIPSPASKRQTNDDTPLKFNSSPLKNGGKGRRSGFLLGQTVTFQGEFAVKLQGCTEKQKDLAYLLKQFQIEPIIF